MSRVGANQIGQLYQLGQGSIDYLTHKALHAMLGAGLGAIKGDAVAGALGGAVGEVIGEYLNGKPEDMAR